jgi:hypothetical protein
VLVSLILQAAPAVVCSLKVSAVFLRPGSTRKFLPGAQQGLILAMRHLCSPSAAPFGLSFFAQVLLPALAVDNTVPSAHQEIYFLLLGACLGSEAHLEAIRRHVATTGPCMSGAALSSLLGLNGKRWLAARNGLLPNLTNATVGTAGAGQYVQPLCGLVAGLERSEKGALTRAAAIRPAPARHMSTPMHAQTVTTLTTVLRTRWLSRLVVARIPPPILPICNEWRESHLQSCPSVTKWCLPEG